MEPRLRVEYPLILTMDEYRRKWKPKGWNIIFIGPTSTWRQEWGNWESIRDIVQNALDETEAYQWGYDDEGMWISDKGRGVAIADFLLGPPKLKPDWARGKFGEGMKISALALVRAGYSVHVETVGREIYVIFLEQEVDGKAQSLAALWRPDGSKIGTTFHLIGYRGDSYEDRFSINLPRSSILFEAPSIITQPQQRFNQLIQHPFPEGSRVFARDIYMRTITSPYSYNLWGFELAPDRFGPRDEGELWKDMGRLWACVDKVELLEILFQMVRMPPLLDTDESHNLNMESWGMGYEPTSQKKYSDFLFTNIGKWQTAWKNQFGENAVIRTNDRWDATVRHLGYEPVNLLWYVRDTIAQIIKTDAFLIKESQERLRDVEVIPWERLTPRQQASLELTRAIASRYPEVAGVEAAIIPPASDRVRTAGMYSRVTREIFISADQLYTGRSTLDTLIHELAHHTSGADDGEREHYDEISRLAGFIVEHFANREYDAITEKPDFSWR